MHGRNPSSGRDAETVAAGEVLQGVLVEHAACGLESHVQDAAGGPSVRADAQYCCEHPGNKRHVRGIPVSTVDIVA